MYLMLVNATLFDVGYMCNELDILDNHFEIDGWYTPHEPETRYYGAEWNVWDCLRYTTPRDKSEYEMYFFNWAIGFSYQPISQGPTGYNDFNNAMSFELADGDPSRINEYIPEFLEIFIPMFHNYADWPEKEREKDRKWNINLVNRYDASVITAWDYRTIKYVGWTCPVEYDSEIELLGTVKTVLDEHPNEEKFNRIVYICDNYDAD